MSCIVPRGAAAFNARRGGESIRLRLSELIFVEVVRQCLESLPAQESGWLSGLRDPVIGKVLAALHQRPAHPWTLEMLAQQAGLSRAALAARFTQLVGYPPMQYPALWRMQIAARPLADGSMKVAAVGREIGYASEAAFSRGFKKSVGVSPALGAGTRHTPACNYTASAARQSCGTGSGCACRSRRVTGPTCRRRRRSTVRRAE